MTAGLSLKSREPANRSDGTTNTVPTAAHGVPVREFRSACIESFAVQSHDADLRSAVGVSHRIQFGVCPSRCQPAGVKSSRTDAITILAPAAAMALQDSLLLSGRRLPEASGRSIPSVTTFTRAMRAHAKSAYCGCWDSNYPTTISIFAGIELPELIKKARCKYGREDGNHRSANRACIIECPP